MATISELSGLDSDDETLLKSVRDQILADDDFSNVDFDQNDDGTVIVRATYAGEPYSYHQDVFYGQGPGARIYDVMENEGLSRPTDNPHIGVKTDNVEGKVFVENTYRPGGGA